MNIKVYAICWNEEVVAPYFIKHYRQFTNDIVVYDNMSTDTTCEILKDCEIRKYDTNEKIRDDIYLDIKNQAWKETIDSNVDWVVICDLDELIYSANLLAILQEAKANEYTMIKPQGYSMIGDSIPTSNMIYDEINMGVEDDNYSKLCMFNPNKITAVNYLPGCHNANPVGDVKILETKNIKLLHFNYISLGYAIDRYATYKPRLSEQNIKNGWGVHYQYKTDQIASEYNNFKSKRTKVI
tara:strand:+ start:3456 stop:4175 length:720 start_codon:yes stop_codon:yes gene_type:complete